MPRSLDVSRLVYLDHLRPAYVQYTILSEQRHIVTTDSIDTRSMSSKPLETAQVLIKFHSPGVCLCILEHRVFNEYEDAIQRQLAKA